MKIRFTLLAFLCGISLAFSQGHISLNENYTASQVIYPFHGINTIYGLDFTGEVTLNDDTSFVRIVLTDSYNNEYLIYEGYSLVVEALGTQYLTNVGQETFYLDEVHPFSIQITIHGAGLLLGSLSYRTYGNQNQDSLNRAYYNSVVEINVNTINARAAEKGLLWRAKVNPVASMTYSEKKQLFGGDNLPLLYGFEYYGGGIFEMPPYGEQSVFTDNLVSDFDWRDRHGSNDSTKGPSFPYYNSTGFGWIPPRTPYGQGLCGDCWAWATVFSAEAYLNLYTNKPWNINLSVAQVRNCSWQNYYLEHPPLPTNLNPCYNFPYHTSYTYAHEIFKNTGVIDENCYPYNLNEVTSECPTLLDPPCILQAFNQIKLANFHFIPNTVEPVVYKEALINTGPLKYNRYSMGHTMCIVGYHKIHEGTIYWNTTNPNSTLTVLAGDTLIGQTYWVLNRLTMITEARGLLSI
ncbi:MAG: hypothetical protein NTU44_00730 [Bacteroidetes bacterium]|nr:hypothetical protein [Bacteroidota bacterium]